MSSNRGRGSDKGSEKVLWQQVANTIATRIERGVYPLQSTLPREVDLSVEFGVSRNTVREALRNLVGHGLLERRRRAGTCVIQKSKESRFVLDLDPLSSIRDLHKKSSLQVLSRARCALPAALRHGWPMATNGNWSRVDCLRVGKIDKKPMSVTQFFVTTELEEITRRVGESDEQVFRLIEAHSNEVMARAHTRLVPVSISGDLAKLLKVTKGTPAMKVIHAMSNAQGIVREFVVSVYPVNRYVFELSFSLQE